MSEKITNYKIDRLTADGPAFEIVCNMESWLGEIRNFSQLLLMAARDIGEDMGEAEGAAVGDLARHIQRLAVDLEEKRGELFHLLHPNREAQDREGVTT